MGGGGNKFRLPALVFLNGLKHFPGKQPGEQAQHKNTRRNRSKHQNPLLPHLRFHLGKGIQQNQFQHGILLFDLADHCVISRQRQHPCLRSSGMQTGSNPGVFEGCG